MYPGCLDTYFWPSFENPAGTTVNSQIEHIAAYAKVGFPTPDEFMSGPDAPSQPTVDTAPFNYFSGDFDISNWLEGNCMPPNTLPLISFAHWTEIVEGCYVPSASVSGDNMLGGVSSSAPGSQSGEDRSTTGDFDEFDLVSTNGTYDFSGAHPSMPAQSCSCPETSLAQRFAAHYAGSSPRIARRPSPSAPPSPVLKFVVATENIKSAAASRRSQVAQYTCSWPGCDTSFTTKFKMHCKLPLPPLTTPFPYAIANKGTCFAGHIKAHLGIKDFVCSLPGCYKAFVRKSDLRRHERQTQHPQPRPAGISGLSVASAGHSPLDGFYYPFNQ
jgi:hypothetical protein